MISLPCLSRWYDVVTRNGHYSQADIDRRADSRTSNPQKQFTLAQHRGILLARDNASCADARRQDERVVRTLPRDCCGHVIKFGSFDDLGPVLTGWSVRIIKIICMSLDRRRVHLHRASPRYVTTGRTVCFRQHHGAFRPRPMRNDLRGVTVLLIRVGQVGPSFISIRSETPGTASKVELLSN